MQRRIICVWPWIMLRPCSVQFLKDESQLPRRNMQLTVMLALEVRSTQDVAQSERSLNTQAALLLWLRQTFEAIWPQIEVGITVDSRANVHLLLPKNSTIIWFHLTGIIQILNLSWRMKKSRSSCNKTRYTKTCTRRASACTASMHLIHQWSEQEWAQYKWRVSKEWMKAEQTH